MGHRRTCEIGFRTEIGQARPVQENSLKPTILGQLLLTPAHPYGTLVRLTHVQLYLCARHDPHHLGDSPVATAVIVLNNFGSDSWNAELYESLSLAARLSIAIKNVRGHGQNIKLSYWLWRVNARAAKFFQAIDDIVAENAPPQPDSPSPTPEAIGKAIATLTELGALYNAIYEEARRRRLLNNSLIAGPVTALRANADQFFELAEWCDLYLHADHVDELFAKANEQRAKGEVYDLSQV